jgi:GNAT superfamily N-acetyltransferase
MSSNEPSPANIAVTVAEVDNASDVADLARLRARWAGAEVTETFTGSFERWWRREKDHRVFWIARAGDRPVAMVNIRLVERMPKPGQPPSRWAYLGNMFVVEDMRDHGLGTMLAGAVVDHADAAGLVHLMLNPSERSVPFYQRLGFSADNAMLVRPGPNP